MTTARQIPHERQHELIEQTLHEVRGDLKWLLEELGHGDDGLSRLDRVEAALDDGLSRLDRVEVALAAILARTDSIDAKLDQVLDSRDS
ncbi:MAG: hypothetical protein OXD50_05410 [Chloroflexi bacterium]|nr:hypothetical protein [Chloroflexota bacterium]